MLKTSNDIIAESFQCLNTQQQFHWLLHTTNRLYYSLEENYWTYKNRFCCCLLPLYSYVPDFQCSYLHETATTTTSLHLCSLKWVLIMCQVCFSSTKGYCFVFFFYMYIWSTMAMRRLYFQAFLMILRCSCIAKVNLTLYTLSGFLYQIFGAANCFSRQMISQTISYQLPLCK